MSTMQRVTRAAREIGEVFQNEGKFAIATISNRLGDTTESTVNAAGIAFHSDSGTYRRGWSAMLAGMRKDSGF